jgi:hypothetical protein
VHDDYTGAISVVATLLVIELDNVSPAACDTTPMSIGIVSWWLANTSYYSMLLALTTAIAGSYTEIALGRQPSILMPTILLLIGAVLYIIDRQLQGIITFFGLRRAPIASRREWIMDTPDGHWAAATSFEPLHLDASNDELWSSDDFSDSDSRRVAPPVQTDARDAMLWGTIVTANLFLLFAVLGIIHMRRGKLTHADGAVTPARTATDERDDLQEQNGETTYLFPSKSTGRPSLTGLAAFTRR